MGHNNKFFYGKNMIPPFGGSKKKSAARNHKVWARRNSHQFELELDKGGGASAHGAAGNGPGGGKMSNRSNGLTLLGLDAIDFPPPLMQQSKTPNNIKSVIR